MKKTGAEHAILGVMVASSGVHAVLVKDSEEGPEAIKLFTRQRGTTQAAAQHTSDREMSEPSSDDVGDFTIEFGGGGSSSSELFLQSEFAGLEDVETQDVPGARPAAPVIPFDLELLDILSECAAMGYAEPEIAFCAALSDISITELTILSEEAKAEKKGKKKGREEKSEAAAPSKKRTGRDKWLAALKTSVDKTIDPERVAFIPMSKSETGSERALAIVARVSGHVSATLSSIRSRKVRMPAVRILDTEVSLYHGLVRTAYYMSTSDAAYGENKTEFAPPMFDGPRKTLLVRAGNEDTIVLFFEDDELQHYESLRSITTYDAPETICSRVLLLQDEYGIGDVQHVLLLSDDREEAIVDSFKMFFSDTRVESLRQYLPKLDEDPHQLDTTSVSVLAVASALRLVSDPLYEGAFTDVNLLPKKLLRKQFKLPVTWHVFALYGLIFATAVFFVGRYLALDREVAEVETKIEDYPEELANADAQVLQARVDSFNAVAEGYKRALIVIDSLLVGSDQWSRGLEETARSAASVRGVWIDRLQPEGGALNIVGNATARDKVVQLAESLNGDIESVTFSEIRESPVFTFRMKVPIKSQLPEAAVYLRERAAVEMELQGGTN